MKYLICSACLLITTTAIAQDYFVTDWHPLESTMTLRPTNGVGSTHRLPVSMEMRWIYEIEPFQTMRISSVETRGLNYDDAFEFPGFNSNVLMDNVILNVDAEVTRTFGSDLNPVAGTPVSDGKFESENLSSSLASHSDISGHWKNFSFDHDFSAARQGGGSIPGLRFEIDPLTYPDDDSITTIGSRQNTFELGMNVGGLFASLEPNYGVSIDVFRSPTPISYGDFRLSAYVAGEPGAFVRGDIDGNGIVDAADLNIIGQNWLTSVEGIANGELTGDGFVDAADLNVVGQNWLKTSNTAQPAAVPEPSGLLLALIALAAIARTGVRK